MKTYLALLKHKARGQLTEELLLAHVAHLKQLKETHQLILCGPFADNDGAMQLLLAENITTADALLQQDPFIREKYYATYELLEWIEANETNNYLLENQQTTTNLTNKRMSQ